MFATPSEAYGFMTGTAALRTAPLLKTMDRVRTFSFGHGLRGASARSVDAIGIEFPGGKTLGNPKNIKMRFDASFTQLALHGKL